MGEQMGLTNSKVHKRKWGVYPALVWTAARPNGSVVHTMWVGLNTLDGWVLLIDYRMPYKTKTDRALGERVWSHFLQKTRYNKDLKIAAMCSGFSADEMQTASETPLVTDGDLRQGMTREQVKARISKDQKIIKDTADELVIEGFDKTWNVQRRNTFRFENNKLIVHSNTAID